MDTGIAGSLDLQRSTTIVFVLEMFSCRWLNLHHFTESSTRFLLSESMWPVAQTKVSCVQGEPNRTEHCPLWHATAADHSPRGAVPQPDKRWPLWGGPLSRIPGVSPTTSATGYLSAEGAAWCWRSWRNQRTWISPIQGRLRSVKQIQDGCICNSFSSFAIWPSAVLLL